ncbi:coiled-coil domain-containing protein [Fusibacter tunisiensis]|uniref:Chromosome segregation ATPase n=1 Tax=Fusibacter tunisiensis TaxID=1008308 RepID=A0ABS2MTK6_9FIRM|nr:hypothetical protein [Fusibacter tunisiensis]MBM7562747.1 chromosome segregation ATPase [Fusibacter tunisiensis]
MPKLSKFRVVNLTYNDTRHIYDETFDFNNGSNGMMLLANGGGKTVLTQMMLQPVIPKTDLKTRKFADYFKNNHKPTLLMSEWILDSDAGKLLTGLVIQNRVRRRRGQDDDQDVLHITTFVIEYHRTETYNIHTIPVVERDAQGHRLMRTYDEIVNDLDKHARKYKDKVFVFNWSDSAEAKQRYETRLGIYGLVQQEWRETILKINKEEAGLQSFFNDAKKSETLIQKKILPIIENKLSDRNSEKVEIQSLVRSHAHLLVKNDQIIRDERIYNRFVTESILYEKELLGLKEAEALRDKAVDHLSGLYLGFKNLALHVHDEISKFEALKKINRHEQQTIKFEEASYEYYKKWDDNAAKIEEAKTLQQKILTLNEKLQEIAHQKNRQEAIKLYHAMAKIEEALRVKQEELSIILESENDFEIDALMSVLNEKYGIEIDRLTLLKDEYIEELKGLDEGIKLLNERIIRLNQDIRADRDQEMAYITRIRQFEDGVKQLNAQNLDFKWEKHPLLSEYDPGLLEAYLVGLQADLDRILEETKAMEIQIETDEQNILSSEQKLSNDKVALNTLENRASNEKKKLDDFSEKYAEIQDLLSQYGVLEDSLFQKDEVESQLKSMIQERELKHQHLVLEKAIVTQRMESLKAGQLNALPEEFASFLESHQIRYEFGYNWLLNYRGDVIPESLYLEHFTVLPYALIMDAEDLKRFRDLIKAYHLTMVVPIVTHEFIKEVLQGIDVSSNIEGLYYHTSFDSNLMDRAYREKEILKYENEIAKIDEDSALIQEGIGRIRKIRFTYDAFLSEYDWHTKDRLSQAYELTLGEINQLRNTIENRTLFITETRGALGRKRKDLKEKEEAGRFAVSQRKQYLQLKEDYLKFLELTEQKNQVHLRLIENERLLSSIQVEADLKKTDKAALINKTTKNDDVLEKIKLKRARFQATAEKNFNKHPFHNETIETLEAKFLAYNQSHGQVKDIQSLVDEWQRQTSEKRALLRGLNVQESSYISASYDAVLHRELVERLQRTEEDLKQLETEHIKLQAVTDNKRIDLEKLKEKILGEFNEGALASRESIVRTDFKERKHENQAQYKAYDSEIARFNSLGASIKASLNRLEDGAENEIHDAEPEVFSIEITEAEIESISGEIVKNLRRLRKSVGSIKQGLTEFYNRLNVEFNQENALLRSLFQNLFKGDNCYSYEFTKRVFDQARTSIDVMLKKHETDLKNVKESEEKLYNFVFERVSTVYEQLREIDKHSSIELKDKYQKMLYIEMPKKETLDVVKLKNYLKTIISYSKHRIEENEGGDLDKYLDSHLNLDKLFDEYVPIRSIKVSISKIEQNKVSKIPWEAVGKVSGGEEFVSVFILFISLMSYARGYQLSRKQSGKVLVMDNPFGPVSSEHLLEPLFKIAKTYDAQLICFTHINTSAITSQFDLIYSLRVVRDAGSSQEHVDVKLIKDLRSGDEYLESGLFETGDVEQLEIF